MATIALTRSGRALATAKPFGPDAECDIRIAGRNTQGVTIFRVAEDEHVVSAARIDESEELLERTREAVVEALGGEDDHIVEWASVAQKVKEHVAKFLYNEIHRRPMVMPVTVEV